MSLLHQAYGHRVNIIRADSSDRFERWCQQSVMRFRTSSKEDYRARRV
jgi:hypothetical protein